jgi:hypothetical protein
VSIRFRFEEKKKKRVMHRIMKRRKNDVQYERLIQLSHHTEAGTRGMKGEHMRITSNRQRGDEQ